MGPGPAGIVGSIDAALSVHGGRLYCSEIHVQFVVRPVDELEPLARQPRLEAERLSLRACVEVSARRGYRVSEGITVHGQPDENLSDRTDYAGRAR
jgi:hypothetical protein